MQAKLLSAITVMSAQRSAQLDQLSLRRWLLESPLYPSALLPGGPVKWQAVDQNHARAVVDYRGLRASLLAHFDPQGRLLSFAAEEEGDLSTPYHGSGEHVARSDYQRIDNMMIPMAFTISRAAQGRLYPFWQGKVTHIAFAGSP